jgi:hypothetical protein
MKYCLALLALLAASDPLVTTYQQKNSTRLLTQ